MARVEAIVIAASAGEPLVTVDRAELLPGIGIAGDRYALRLGHWSDPRWPDQELTLFEAEVAERLDLDPIAMRRNVVTRGVRLRDLIGQRFAIGSCEAIGVRACDPCGYIERFTRKGLLALLGEDGGLRATIVRGGVIQRADAIAVIATAPGREAAGASVSSAHP